MPQSVKNSVGNFLLIVYNNPERHLPYIKAVKGVNDMSKIILTGDRPTGRLHVGHYVGSLKRRVELQNSGMYDKIFIMIADAQALTDNAEQPEKSASEHY